ncbi:MAG: hypothetical protein JRI41_06760, partial [Deltaproteobacteria bacterium]|nr:hypothetical protein [Deltaproteobacteria bacterium]
MRKLLCLSVILLFAGCAVYNPRFAPESTIQNVRNSVVAIAVYYIMDEEGYRDYLEKRPSGVWVPVKAKEPYKAVAYLGAGTIVRGGYIVTVRHLFKHDLITVEQKIWIMYEGGKDAVEA